MAYEVLTEAQVEQFIEQGWVKVPGAYAREDALAVQDFVWTKVAEQGVLREDRATWTKPLVQIQQSFDGPEFQACNTPRLIGAIEDLIGHGRWKDRGLPSQWGWWPVNFPQGADADWDVPTRSWHWDGQHFRHFLNSPDQGLLLICYFSEVKPRGGGTLIAPGSHKLVARFLQGHPEGLDPHEAIRACCDGHPWLADLSGRSETRYSEDAPASRIERFMEQSWFDADATELRVEEVTAEPGDAFLCHPFLFHTASTNITGEPRFMCNRGTTLREPTRLEREDGDYSALEESLRRAVGVTVA